MDKLLTMTEAAIRLGVSQSRVSQLVKEGRLVQEKFNGGRVVRIRESVVERFLAEREIPEALPA